MASESRTAVVAALIGNVAIAATKFVAAAMSGSSAMLSEAIHSVVDTGNEVLLLLGLHRAQLPPNDLFPFGRGKEIYFWSFVVSILIFAVGAGVSLYEGILHLGHPVMLTDALVSYIVLVLATLFESGSWWFAYRGFRKEKGSMGVFEAVRKGKNPTLFVVLFEDTAALLGLLVALAGVFLTDQTGNPLYDGAASVVIGLLLAATAVVLARETHGLLIGESADQEVVQGIRVIAARHEGVAGVNEVLTMHMGPEFILVNIGIDFDDAITAGKLESLIARIDDEIKQAYPLVRRVFVESEPRLK